MKKEKNAKYNCFAKDLASFGGFEWEEIENYIKNNAARRLY